MSVIARLFGHSPVRPLQQHMEAAVGCARVVKQFTDAMASGDREALVELRAQIDRLEHEADRIKHEIRSHLPQRLLMAVQRRDLLEILDCQDSVADVAQDIAGLGEMRGMVTPEALRQPLADLVDAALATCDQSLAIVNELDELIETGFGRRESERVGDMISRLNELESSADELGERAMRTLFAIEEEVGVGVYFWYEMIRWVGDMADYAEKAGNRVRLLIAS